MTQRSQGPKSENGRRKGRWSQAELEKLKLRYGLYADTVISHELNRSVESVRRMAHMVFKGEPRIGPWSAEEVLQLKRYIGVATVSDMALILRRSTTEIRRKVEELGRQMADRPWNSVDRQHLKQLYGTRSDYDLGIILGRTEESIRREAQRLCLAKDKSFLRRQAGTSGVTRMPRWSKEELRLLRELYPVTDNLEIARRLPGRTTKSVVSKAHDLGLRKDPARLREMGRENVRKRYRNEEGDG